MAYMLVLVLMTLTLMQAHSGSAKEKCHRWICSTTKQAISMKRATAVGHLLRDLDFENAYISGPTCFRFQVAFLMLVFYVLIVLFWQQVIHVASGCTPVCFVIICVFLAGVSSGLPDTLQLRSSVRSGPRHHSHLHLSHRLGGGGHSGRVQTGAARSLVS